MQYFMDKTVHLFTARITTKMTITHSSLFGVYVHFCPALSTCFHNTPGSKRHYSKYIPKTIGRQKPFHFRSRGTSYNAPTPTTAQLLSYVVLV